MAIKKSGLYASPWASCDALRGGMDASQYKDCVLLMKSNGTAACTLPHGVLFRGNAEGLIRERLVRSGT